MSEVCEKTFALPDVGEGLTEAEILTWRVAVGDTVAVNDVLVEIETAKSVVELPSPFAGVVTGLLVEEGTTVPVGTPIIAIGVGDQRADREPTLVGYGARRSGPRRRRKVPADLGTVVQLHGGHEHDVRRRVRVKPPVRKLAKDLGVDVNEVPATGSTVTRADVEAYAASRSSHAAATSTSAAVAAAAVPEARPVAAPLVGSEVRVPVRGVRKAMAEAMVQSARSAPHATEWLTVDVSRTVELVARLQRDRAFDGVKVTPTVVVAKAVCLAMRHTPSLNATWLEASGDQAAEVLMHGSVNLGIAVATERGLVVPNVKSAEHLSMVELAREIDRLTTVAREGHIQPADQAGGTFTVTNVGVFGVDAGTPILNVGESGILAVGAIQRRPWVDEDDTVVPRWVTTLAVSFDHRIVDGAEAARFLTDVGDILRDPATALTY
ncbi:MAG TPA: dihydrolipoamide acetyltransferase family protein [Aeromicrobium sp.]|nr:dihydrolipoamide acetyltransferase family protein [Aeromicrobium sp.]